MDWPVRTVARVVARVVAKAVERRSGVDESMERRSCRRTNNSASSKARKDGEVASALFEVVSLQGADAWRGSPWGSRIGSRRV